MAANIKIIRLSLGYDLVGSITEDNGHSIIVDNPVRVLVVPSKTSPNAPSVAFVPYCEFSEDRTVEFDRKHVVSLMNPISEFVNQYNSMFGGVIVPQQSKLIIP